MLEAEIVQPLSLRAERLNRGLSLEVAARRMGIGAMTLRRAERRERVPHPDTAKKIADYYGRRVTDFWPDPDERTGAA